MKNSQKIRRPLSDYADYIGMAGLLLITLALWRFDFSYSLPAYRVQPGDSLWTILTEKVFHESKITRLSLKYLGNQGEQQAQLNHIEANTEPGIQNGDMITIKNNELTVTTAGQKTRIPATPVLPPTGLRNHFLQVAFHNLLVAVGFLIVMPMFLMRNKQSFNKKSPLAFFQSGDFILFVLIFMPLTFWLNLLIWAAIHALSF